MNPKKSKVSGLKSKVITAMVFGVCCLVFGNAFATSVYFPVAEMTGATNDVTLNVKAVNNPMIYNGSFYYLPKQGTNLTTSGGYVTNSFVPGRYTVTISGLQKSWNMYVTNSASVVSAVDLSSAITIYSGIQSLTGRSIQVTNDGLGNITITDTNAGGGGGEVTTAQLISSTNVNYAANNTYSDAAKLAATNKLDTDIRADIPATNGFAQSQIVNVLDYGAVPHQQTGISEFSYPTNRYSLQDNGATIQAAINAAYASRGRSNTVHFPHGVWMVGTNLYIPPGISLSGVGLLHAGDFGSSPNRLDTNAYSVLWMTNSSYSSIVFSNLNTKGSQMSFLEVNGYTNPFAYGSANSVNSMATNTSANLANGPGIYLGNPSTTDWATTATAGEGYSGDFQSYNSSIVGFKVGVRSSANSCNFFRTHFVANDIGYQTTADCCGGDQTVFNNCSAAERSEGVGYDYANNGAARGVVYISPSDYQLGTWIRGTNMLLTVLGGNMEFTATTTRTNFIEAWGSSTVINMTGTRVDFYGETFIDFKEPNTYSIGGGLHGCRIQNINSFDSSTIGAGLPSSYPVLLRTSIYDNNSFRVTGGGSEGWHVTVGDYPDRTPYDAFPLTHGQPRFAPGEAQPHAFGAFAWDNNNILSMYGVPFILKNGNNPDTVEGWFSESLTGPLVHKRQIWGDASTSTAAAAPNRITLDALTISTGGVITNGAVLIVVTNTTPTYAAPNGSLALVSDGRLYMRTNGAWSIFGGGGGGDLLAANNLSDVGSAGTSRTNLAAHNADNLTTGTVPADRLSLWPLLTMDSSVELGWVQQQADGLFQITKNGDSLTNLAANELRSGTVDPARLGSGSSITTKFLRGDSTWQPISGGGDMLASTYDTNANGRADWADNFDDSAANTVVSNATFTIITNRGAINVKDYGATGDGSTDDTAAIQAALDAAPAIGASVFFPRTTTGYKVDGTLYPGLGTTMFGEANKVGTVSQLIHGTAATPLIVISEVGTYVKNLALLGSGVTAGSAGIVVSNTAGVGNWGVSDVLIELMESGIVLTNCWIGEVERTRINACVTGIRFSNTVNNITVSGGSILRCTNGVAGSLTSSSANIFNDGLNIERSRFSAFDLSNSAGALTISGCYFEWNTNSSVKITGIASLYSKPIIAGNYFTGSGTNIVLSGLRQATIENNSSATAAMFVLADSTSTNLLLTANAHQGTNNIANMQPPNTMIVGDAQYVAGVGYTNPGIVGKFMGDGAAVTNFNADNIASGTIGEARLPDSATVTGWALGASTATTPAENDNDTSLATTAYVQTEIAGFGSGQTNVTDTAAYQSQVNSNLLVKGNLDVYGGLSLNSLTLSNLPGTGVFLATSNDIVVKTNIPAGGAGDAVLSASQTWTGVNTFSNKINMDAAHALYLSNLTTARVLVYNTANGVTNTGATGPLLGTGSAAAFSDIQTLAPGTILTNGMSVSAQLSNSLRLSALSYFYPSNVTVSRLLTATTAGGLTNLGISAASPLNSDGTATTFAQINSLAPNSGASYVLTNGMSVSVQLSNSLRLSALSYFYPSNVTAGKVLTVTTAGGLTNSGLGAVPVNGDTTATTSAQVNALFPSNIATNGASPDFASVQVRGIGVVTNTWTTNSLVGLGTNYTAICSASTGGGITGVVTNAMAGNLEWISQITIKSVGDHTFTNPTAFYTSDAVDTRVFTNGNLTTVLIQVIPNFSTNLSFSWSK